MSSREKQRKKELNLGKVILESSGYICKELLGQGAFSSVYCVERKSDSHLYACKISKNIVMLQREAELMALLRHPLFPEYSAFWQDAGLGFLLREYISGTCLEEMLARKRYFSVEETVHTGLELAEGLCYLHERPERFLFRDLKPANLIVSPDSSVKLIDLGCVCSGNGKITSRAGTPGFAAPEQLLGIECSNSEACLRGEKKPDRTEALTEACDVYALGRTLKAMLGPGQGTFFWSRRRKKRKKLEKFLDACTKETLSQRVCGMRDVIAVLGQL